MLTKFEMTFPGTPVDLWHGDEEKQGAHMKREAGAGMRIGKQKERSHNARGRKGEELQFRECRASATSKPGELFHDPNLNISSIDTC